ncbi:hypothetical protein SBOR_7539 [Sclerotinia borealis F-4128]|uniref:Uncharacterized protein n=1 Tax=Sclerotinia borealis (strain F-4128) TaxID=1432307 RepID=W9C5P5_SCLBF|nr:hypothetical protein SBOR_7539 [Sclerotinia borealis F-4128]
MGCGSSKMDEEIEGKNIRSMTSRDSDESNDQNNYNCGRSDERNSLHREKETCHNRNRDLESNEWKPFAADEKPQMGVMTDEDYSRYRDTEELRMEHNLARDISELEGDNEYMEREMRDIENEHGYEERYRERDRNRDRDYETSPDSRRYRRDDDRSYYSSDISPMSSMLSVLHESPEEG